MISLEQDYQKNPGLEASWRSTAHGDGQMENLGTLKIGIATEEMENLEIVLS